MAISKIILNGVTQIDLTSDTVAASNLIAPNTAHGADGQAIVGIASGASEPNLQAKTNISPTTSSQTITPDTGYDGLSSVQINAMPSGTEGTPTATKGTVSNHQVSVTPSVTNTAGYISGSTKTGTAVTVTASELDSGTKSISANGTGIDVVGYATVDVVVPGPSLQAKTGISPSTSSQTIEPDNGYDGLSSVQINAMPTMTLPTSASSSSSGTSKATIGRSTSDQYINIPTGYNSSGAYYKINAVANGTEGTPTATKGTVSNHQVSITPSVTNTTGYITGGTKTGTAVTVTASELASGNKEIMANGIDIDVVGYSTVSVNVESEDFIITLSYNSTTEMWEPDVTLSQIQSAYNNNSNIIVNGLDADDELIQTSFGYSTTNALFWYDVAWNDYDNNSFCHDYYTFDANNGLRLRYRNSYTTPPNLQAKTNISPTTSSQTIQADSGYDGLSSVQINAMPTMTLPTSASLSSSGTSKATIGRSTSAQYINIPTGYNETASYYTISATPNGSVTTPSSISGTVATITTGTNTLTLTKTVSVTPNVTTAGYISSGTAGNASVSLTASVNIRTSSDLTISGATVTAPAGYYSEAASKSVSSMTLPTSTAASATSGFTSKATVSRSTSNQYINIPVGYNASGAYYKINAVANGTEGTPTATKGTVSNHQISITPSVTNTAGYIAGGTKTGTAVTVTASELASGNKAIVDNGTGIDVVGYSTVSVAVPFSTITVSSSNPSGGNNGDVWIKTS